MNRILQVVILSVSCTKFTHGYSPNDAIILDRTFDLTEYGIDLNETLSSLLTPSGIVNQFALSAVLQFILIIGYAVSGRNK